MFGNEELRPFLETPKLILTYIQIIDIGLKQRLMKMKQNAYCHKINTGILAEKKSTSGCLCVFKSFQYILTNGEMIECDTNTSCFMYKIIKTTFGFEDYLTKGPFRQGIFIYRPIWNNLGSN